MRLHPWCSTSTPFPTGGSSLLTNQEGVWREQKIEKVFFDVRAVECKKPLPKISIFPTHDSVDGHLNCHDYFSHVCIVTHAGGAVLYKYDNCRVPRAISV